METRIGQLLLNNWQRKCLALLTALIVWVFVNHSISETKVIPSVPIRIVNLPPDKTILSLLPNGILNKRITLTLTGTKDVIQELEPGDLEVLIDASIIDHDDWIVQVSKKNLVSLNPAINLGYHITQVVPAEHVIRMRRLVKEQVPITILPPTGNPPPGYEFLDIWPQQLTQTVSGAEEEIQKLKETGLKFTFNLSNVTKADLDVLRSENHHLQNDEISFHIPSKWKMINISFRNNALEELNDPEAEYLRIDFLKKEFLPVSNSIPVHVFYPTKYSQEVNPETDKLAIVAPIEMKNGIPLLMTPLFIRDVSRLFLEIIRENIELAIIAAPKSEKDTLEWSVEVLDPHNLENAYVKFLAENGSEKPKAEKNGINLHKELLWRNRFRDYLHRMRLYTSPDRKFDLEVNLKDHMIEVKNK